MNETHNHYTLLTTGAAGWIAIAIMVVAMTHCEIQRGAEETDRIQIEQSVE